MTFKNNLNDEKPVLSGDFQRKIDILTIQCRLIVHVVRSERRISYRTNSRGMIRVLGPLFGPRIRLGQKHRTPDPYHGFRVVRTFIRDRFLWSVNNQLPQEVVANSICKLYLCLKRCIFNHGLKQSYAARRTSWSVECVLEIFSDAFHS